MNKKIVFILIGMVITFTSCGENIKEVENDVIDNLQIEEMSKENVQIESFEESLQSEGISLESVETEASEEVRMVYEALPELSEKIESFQIQIDEHLYSFPMSYQEFVDRGWEYDTTYKDISNILPYCDEIVMFEKEGQAYHFDLFNPDVSAQHYSKCYISGIRFTEHEKIDDIYIPGGFKVWEATKEDVLSGLREPDSIYEGDTLKTLTYDTENVWSNCQLTFDENDILIGCSMSNPIEPEGFIPSEPDPNIIPNYTKPTQMGTDVMEGIVEFCGDLYQLPAPVSAFVENGWSVENLDDTVAGDGYRPINILRDGKSIHLATYNDNEIACTVENAVVKELCSWECSGEFFEVSGGISTEMTEEDLIKIINNYGFEYNFDENSERRQYAFYTTDVQYQDYCIVSFSEGRVSITYNKTK